MGEYFKPLRRKIGVVMVLIALAFLAGWIRGFFVIDNIYLRMQPASHAYLTFASQGIVFRRTDAMAGTQLPGPSEQWHDVFTLSELDRNDPLGLTISFSKVKWRWRKWGFDFGESWSVSHDVRNNFGCIPYSTITIPLTLISAYLLLSRPCMKRLPVPPPSP